jgi:hypothetical protein
MTHHTLDPISEEKFIGKSLRRLPFYIPPFFLFISYGKTVHPKGTYFAKEVYGGGSHCGSISCKASPQGEAVEGCLTQKDPCHQHHTGKSYGVYKEKKSSSTGLF